MTVTAEICQGTLIDGRYRIQRTIGQGGFGRTYLVSDERRFDELCVLKEFVPNIPAAYTLQKAKELFQREAKILYELNHPQIPKFLAWFEEYGRLFLVQQYVDGKTYAELLRDRVACGQTFSETEVVQWLIDLLPVLDYLHSCKMIHRDISPDNVMLPAAGDKPVLIDLGAVKQVMSEVRSGSLRSTTESGYALLVGKLGYAPPEQIDRGQCYPSSDLYALAVTALVFLTGKEPDEQDNFDSWFNRDMQIGERLAYILAKMLAEVPTKRYQSAREVLTELQSLLVAKEEAVPQAEIKAPARKKRPKTQVQLKTIVQTIARSRIARKKFPIALPSLSLRSIAPIAIASTVLIGGLSVAFLSPRIAGLCNAFNNCAVNKNHEFLYSQASEEGKQAIAIRDRARSIADLQTVRNRLGMAVIHLNAIPKESGIYLQSRRLLNDYQSRLDEVQTQLTQEEQAEQLIAAIAHLSEEASKQTESANTMAQYQSAKLEWEAIIKRLKAMPSNTFVREKIQSELAQANAQLKSVQAEIDRQINANAKKSAPAMPNVESNNTAAPQLSPKVETPAPPQNAIVKPAPTVRQESTPKTPPTAKPTTSRPAIETPANSEKQQPEIAPETPPSETATNNATPSVTARVSSYQNSDRDISISYANDLVYGLLVAQREGQIKRGTRTYRRVQTAIRLLRRGKSLEEATALSGVPSSVIAQLVEWGQNRPSGRRNVASP